MSVGLNVVRTLLMAARFRVVLGPENDHAPERYMLTGRFDRRPLLPLSAVVRIEAT
jgi:hypothetical protein